MYKNALFIFLLILITISGTISDTKGLFQLHIEAFPCELILSHVSYQVLSFPIQNSDQISSLEIMLKKKIVPLSEAFIISNCNREKYISRFKLWFLGKDYSQTGAEILNDSVLHFIPMEGGQFKAYAREALLRLKSTPGESSEATHETG